jgi:outer membrane protein assembly factor BamB
MNGKKVAVVLAITLISSAAISYAGTPGMAKWSPYHTGGAATGSPAVGPGGSPLYITSEDGYLYAINPATWTASWNPVNVHNLLAIGSSPSDLICSPVVACDGTIYVASSDQNLYSVNPNGTVKWSMPVGHSYYPPTVGALAIGANGTLYVTWDDDFNLYAVNSQGATLWTLNLQSVLSATQVLVDSPPAVGPDGTIYLYATPVSGNNDEILVAVQDQGSSASVKWVVNLGFSEDQNDFQSTLALDNSGRIYAPYSMGSYSSTSLQAFNTANGAPVWSVPFSTPDGAAIHTSPAIAPDGTIYIGADDGVLYAVNPNGTKKWQFDTLTSQPIRSSPAVTSDGSVVFGAGNGTYYVKDNGTSGTKNWYFQTPSEVDSSPLIIGSDNAVYFGCSDDNVYAVYGNAPLAASPWPMFENNAQRTASAATNVINWVSGSLQGPSSIYKGYTGIGYPRGGKTSFTISRTTLNCSPVQVTFFLGPDNPFTTPYQNYDPFYAYYGLDFTVSGCHTAPFPNGFYVIIPPGQTSVTFYVQTLDSEDSEDPQTLDFLIPSEYPPPGNIQVVPPSSATVTVYPDPWP